MNDAPGSAAASVASQLLAFFREPARFRPHYIHGDERLPEGHVVLKFALGRFSHGWHRDLPPARQAELGEAARAFVRQVCLWDRATAYQVLCLDRGAGREAIKENYRLLMALLHPDRPDADAWPADSAQRVNDAYAMLSDAALRHGYDDGIRKSHLAGAFEHPEPSAPRPGMAPRPRPRAMARTFVVVGAVVAALFAGQAWWVGDVPSHYTLLESAFPLRASAQWVRDALPDARLIDFTPAATFAPLELLAPSRPTHRLASVSAWTPLPVAADTTAPRRALEAASPAPVPVPVPASPAAAPAAEGGGPALRLAQATAPVREAPPPAQPRAGLNAIVAPTPEHVEMLVARLVSFYEAGDAQGLVDLFDPDEMGFWKGVRTRSTYSDFFRATRERRLRMERLQWQTAARLAQARGDATVVADYVDGTGKLERKVEVEIDIRLRDGQARITRLLLFPDGK